mgnify:CR=1 FL=1
MNPDVLMDMKERLSRGLPGGNMKRIIMAACIVSLAACGGDKDDVATEQQQEWEFFSE